MLFNNGVKHAVEKKKEVYNISNSIIYGSYDFLVKLASSFKPVEYDISGDNLCFKNNDIVTYLLKSVNNNSHIGLQKELVTILKNIELYNRPGTISASQLPRFNAFIANEIMENLFGESEIVKTYFPRLDEYLLDFDLARLINIHGRDKTHLIEDIHNEVADKLYDILVLDLTSRFKLFISLSKLNKKLDELGQRTIKFDDLDRTITKDYLDDLKDINSYLLACQIHNHFTKDSYKAGKEIKEIHTTKQYDPEILLDDLGLNYVKNNGIIKSLR